VDFPFAKLAEDISAEQPSGPDLEAEGDVDFMRFMAQIDGTLPQSFASFDRAEAALPQRIAEVAALLQKSKDLRLLVAAAKLFILDRNLAAFEQAVSAAAAWLDSRWETLNPELLDGDPIMRSIALTSLDDIPHTVKPLEAAPLFRSRRAGAISLRSSLLAEGHIQPRQGDAGEDEKAPTPGDISAAIREAELDELLAARATARRLLDAIGAIERSWDERTGRSGDLRLKELGAKALEVLTFLDRAAAIRDPSLAAPAAESSADEAGPGAPAAGPSPGAVANLGDAREAMAAAERYFRLREPSSPVRLVLAQADALVGKSFFDALQQLMPEIASRAAISLGRDLPLKLPMERLAQLMPLEDGEPSGEDASGSDAAGYESDASEPDDAATDAPEAEGAAAEDTPPRPGGPRFAAATRAEALALLEAAASYFRAVEPSSGVPLLIDIAKGAAGRDFLALVRESFPASALAVDD
jgi:type VI secretion system protein ImpA